MRDTCMRGLPSDSAFAVDEVVRAWPMVVAYAYQYSCGDCALFARRFSHIASQYRGTPRVAFVALDLHKAAAKNTGSGGLFVESFSSGCNKSGAVCLHRGGVLVRQLARPTQIGLSSAITDELRVEGRECGSDHFVCESGVCAGRRCRSAFRTWNLTAGAACKIGRGGDERCEAGACEPLMRRGSLYGIENRAAGGADEGRCGASLPSGAWPSQALFAALGGTIAAIAAFSMSSGCQSKGGGGGSPPMASSPAATLSGAARRRELAATPVPTPLFGGRKGDRAGPRVFETPQMTQQPERIGGYQLVRKLGEGGFGAAYAVRADTGMGPRSVPRAKDEDRDPTEPETAEFLVMKRVRIGSVTEVNEALQEVKQLSRLRHPNVVRHTDFFLHRHRGALEVAIVMEYCEGGDLYEVLQRSKDSPLSEDTLLMWIGELCSALQYVHSRDIVHRDLKPDNILLSSGHVRVADFGLSRVVPRNRASVRGGGSGGGARRAAMTVCGTDLYMAPEVLREEPYGTKADVWSLGVVVLEMAMGALIEDTPPGSTRGEFLEALIATRIRVELNSARPLRQLIRRMLSASPGERYDMNRVVATPLVSSYLPVSAVGPPSGTEAERASNMRLKLTTSVFAPSQVSQTDPRFPSRLRRRPAAVGGTRRQRKILRSNTNAALSSVPEAASSATQTADSTGRPKTRRSAKRASPFGIAQKSPGSKGAKVSVPIPTKRRRIASADRKRAAGVRADST